MFNAMDDETYNTIRQHIPNFEKLPDEEKQEISSFTWLWSTFEGKHCDTNATQQNLTAFAERNVVSDNMTAEHAICAWNYFKDRYLPSDAEQNYLDHLMGNIPNRGRRIRSAITAGLDNDATTNEKCIALVLIIYRMRNNLFHGTKGQYGFVDQFENFKHANELLRSWIEIPK